jgi:hypothetical protein
VVELQERQTRIYDEAARFFQTALGCIEHAKRVLHVADIAGHPAKRILAHYWGARREPHSPCHLHPPPVRAASPSS